MPSDNTIIKSDPAPLEWSQVEVPGGHTLKDGRTIDVDVIVPDGALGYGDKESAALMAADIAAARSTDSGAGDKAYEDAREQLDIDFHAEYANIKRQKLCAKEPVFEAYEDRDGAGTLRGFHVISAYDQPNGKWDKPYFDRASGRTLYPRIDYIEMDEQSKVSLFMDYGVAVA